jgi:uncharacterized protein YhaN
MRLESFRLLKYGPFEDFSLALDARPGCLNIVCAPNGAGKSVLRQAFGDLLFGIGGQTPMHFRFGYQGMRLAAVAVTPDGVRHAFGRRKGNRNTWTDGDGNAVENPAIAACFAGTGAKKLEQLFALDTERLRRGGTELLTEDGGMASALLSAGGLSGARARRLELEQIADGLAPLRKSANRPFYMALENFTAARKAAKEALLRPVEWEKLERERDETAALLAGHRERAAVASAEVARLERVRRVRVPLARHDAAQEWLRAHPDAPDLPASLGPTLAEAGHRLAVARQQVAQETGRHRTLVVQHAAITVDESLLAEAGEIDRLAEKAGAVEQALADIPLREAEHAQLGTRIAALLRRLAVNLPVEQAGECLPAQAAKSQARILIGRHDRIAASLQDARAAFDALSGDIAEAEAALGALSEVADHSAIGRLAAAIRAEGNPAAQARDAVQALERARAAVASALAGVPAWQGDETSLLGLVPPSAASLERGHRRLVDAEAARARCRDAAAGAAERRDRALGALSGLRAGEGIPDRAAIDAARLHRDAGYALIARLAFGGAAPSAAEIEAFARGGALALAYEQAVARADRLADRQASESQLVAQAAEAARTLADAEFSARTAEAALVAAKGEAAAAAASWRESLPAGLPGDARLEDVRAFLAARTRVIELVEARDNAASRAGEIAARHAAWAASLAAALGVTAPLPALLSEGDARVEGAARIDKERTSLAGGLEALRRQTPAVQAAREAAEAALVQWREEWAASLAALGRPAAEHPAVTADVLGVFDELSQVLAQTAEKTGRLDDMRRSNAAFVAEVGALAARMDQVAASGAVAMLGAIRALRARLAEQREFDARRRGLAQQAEAAAATVAELGRAVAAREAAWAEVLKACGATDAAGAELRLAASAERAAQAGILTESAALLAEGDGLSLEQLREEVAALPADAVMPALEAARAAAGAAQEAALQGSASLALLGDGLQRRSQDSAYREARAAEAEAASSASRVLREALAARLAAALLGQAMEAVEREGGSDLLTRIAGWFARLTGGAYRSVATEPGEDGRPVLVAVPADRPDELKRVDQLSEGTRDQLFLALRLEAVAHADCLPFIADDILQTFDDVRAEAALEALLELSERVQVIVLTHHLHILDLAGRLPAGRVHICGELGR